MSIIDALHKLVNTSAAKRPRYTLKRATPDARDHVYVNKGHVIPDIIDFEDRLPPCWDQGQIGSCTGHGWVAMMVFLFGINNMFSRLFVYFIERFIEGTVNEDNGAEIRTGGKALAKYGAPPETLWAYAVRKFKLKPAAAAWTAALGFKLPRYMQVNSVEDMLDCLADGYPLVVGLTLYESFESDATARTGMVPMPQPGEKTVGGHCMLVMGSDKKRRLFKLRNSWKNKWGIRGHCYVSFDYFRKRGLADPSWTARLS